jgi:hypothetical protein
VLEIILSDYKYNETVLTLHTTVTKGKEHGTDQSVEGMYGSRVKSILEEDP